MKEPNFGQAKKKQTQEKGSTQSKRVSSKQFATIRPISSPPKGKRRFRFE